MQRPAASLAERTRASARTTAFTAHVAGTLAAYEAQSRTLPPDQRPQLLQRYRKRFCRQNLAMFGVGWELSPWPPPASHDRARLVLANHRSVLDIPVLVAAFGGALVSRHDVAEWPLLGTFATRAGTIFVDRESRSSGVVAIRTIRRRLEQGETVVMFPEGRTYAGDEVREFHGGAFAAARGLDVEVWPVGIAHEPGTEYVGMPFVQHLASIAKRPGSRVVARVGEPQPVEGRSQALAETTRRTVQRLVNEARAQFDES